MIPIKISNLCRDVFNDKFQERINNGVKIAKSTITIPIVSINPNNVPKIKYDKMTFKSIDVKCNLIDIIVEVDDSVNVSTIKTMSKELLKVFSTEETKFYDIQLLIKSNKKDSDTYPIIGTHHKEIDGSVNDHFVW